MHSHPRLCGRSWLAVSLDLSDQAPTHTRTSRHQRPRNGCRVRAVAADLVRPSITVVCGPVQPVRTQVTRLGNEMQYGTRGTIVGPACVAASGTTHGRIMRPGGGAFATVTGSRRRGLCVEVDGQSSSLEAISETYRDRDQFIGTLAGLRKTGVGIRRCTVLAWPRALRERALIMPRGREISLDGQAVGRHMAVDSQGLELQEDQEVPPRVS